MKLSKAEPLVQSPGVDFGAVFSPDGKWVAYFSDESGQYEVYVQRFPGGGGRRKVSDGTGIWPKWSANGRQLLYSDPIKQHVMAVDYQGSGDAFVAGKPHEWSATPVRQVGGNSSWDVDPKTDRAVVIPVAAAPGDEGPPKVAYLLHFFDELRRKVPATK
jgi:hypothetical protein